MCVCVCECARAGLVAMHVVACCGECDESLDNLALCLAIIGLLWFRNLPLKV